MEVIPVKGPGSRLADTTGLSVFTGADRPCASWPLDNYHTGWVHPKKANRKLSVE